MFYDKASKNKLIKCPNCNKVFHKKCLDEDDAARLKTNPNEWKCDDCERKFQISKHSKNNLKITNDLSLEEAKRKNTRLTNKEEKIVLETPHIKEL